MQRVVDVSTVWTQYHVRARARLLAEAPRRVRRLVGYDPLGFKANVPADQEFRELGVIVKTTDAPAVAGDLGEDADVSDVWIEGPPLRWPNSRA